MTAKVVYAVGVIGAIDKALELVNSKTFKATDIKRMITSPAIDIHDT